MISRSHPYDLIGGTQKMRRDQQMSSNVHTNFQDKKVKDEVFKQKENLNAPRPSEHPPVRGEKCQNVQVRS